MLSEGNAQSILERYRPIVDTEMRRVLEGRSKIALYDMVRYHLGFAGAAGEPVDAPGGKRVRSTFCLLACEAAGGDAASAAAAGAAIELVHSFTLLHDDIADHDEMRRGRATAWKLWGIGQAITAGDAVYALANLAAGGLEGQSPPGVALAVLRELNQAVLDICEGQQLDIFYEGKDDLSQADYLRMIGLKTAALLRSACAIGATIGGAGAETVEALGGFGFGLGVAYQIQDDILGAWGDPEQMGKPVGSDLQRNKRTLPIILALAGEDAHLRSRLRTALERGVSPEQAAELAATMAEKGIRRECEAMAQRTLDDALSRLDRAGLAAPEAADLRTLASYLAERTR
jgi:geranylgeranyl diphosphate synthase type I